MHWKEMSTVNARWARTHETPEWIAERADIALDRLRGPLGVACWKVTGGPEWTPQLDKPAYLRNVARRRNGESWETGGFGCATKGENRDLTASLWFHSGEHRISRRLPKFTSTIDFLAKRPGAITEARANAAVAALVEAWNPRVVNHGNLEVLHLEERGGWQTPSAQRLWLNDEVGPIHTIPDVITATRLGPGTLLTMPDNTPAADVVAAMAAFRDANNLDTYYDAARPPPRQPPTTTHRARLVSTTSQATGETERESTPPMDYRTQITGWLPAPDGRIPSWQQPDPLTGHPVPYEGRTLRGEQKQEVLLQSFDENELLQLHNGPQGEGNNALAHQLVGFATAQTRAKPEAALLEWHFANDVTASIVKQILEQFNVTNVTVRYTPRITE